MSDIYSKGVYFLADSTTFSYTATCLADGLHQLGIPIFANISYDDPLISDFEFEKCSEPDRRKNAYCVLVDLQDTRQYYEQMIRFETRYERTIVLCMQDDVGNFCIDGVDMFLCAHENRFRNLAGVRTPVGFGVSSSMISKSMKITPHAARNNRMLYTFRPSLNQDLRASLDLVLLPALKQKIFVFYQQGGAGRWTDAYFDLLSSNVACLAYGGTFEQDYSISEYLMRNERFRNFSSCIKQQCDTVILRWDSWRFWESLIFGCVTIHLDFDRYGFMLPEMPENWKHYIGINLADVPRDVERMMDEREHLPEIAWNGRQWAIEHYSPVAVAKRFLLNLSSLERSNR